MRPIRLLILVITSGILLGPPVALAQIPAAAERNLKMRISERINMALPEARRGLQILQGAGGDQEQILRATAALYTSYKHLRWAQERSENLQSDSAFADPLVKIRNNRVQQIRDRLRFCRDNEGLMVKQDSETTASCLQGLVEAVRSLELVVATMY